MNDFAIDYKNNRILYFYYLFLHILCLSWTNLQLVAPPLPLRLLVTSAIFIPLIKYFWLSPAVIILFVGIRFNSVAPFGYIPQSWDSYFGLFIIIGLLHNIIYRDKLFHFTKKQLGIALFIFLIDMINLKIGTEFLFFVFLLFLCYNTLKSEKAVSLTILSFVLFSISMSVYYMIFAREFAVSYASSDGLERAFWVDPNYLGVYLGIGVVFSVYYLINAKNYKLNIFYKFIFVFCSILTAIVILLQASRGSLLTLALALIIILFQSHIKFQYKLLSIIFLILLVVIFFQEGFFDLLINRMSEDDGTGSGRTEIWSKKLDYLLENPIYFIGAGYLGSLKTFPPFNFDCHNEYISLLLNYGVAGLMLFFVEVIRLFRCRNANRTIVLSMLIFSIVAFMTISPFACPTGWLGIPLSLPLLFKLADNRIKR